MQPKIIEVSFTARLSLIASFLIRGYILASDQLVSVPVPDGPVVKIESFEARVRIWSTVFIRPKGGMTLLSVGWAVRVWQTVLSCCLSWFIKIILLAKCEFLCEFFARNRAFLPLVFPILFPFSLLTLCFSLNYKKCDKLVNFKLLNPHSLKETVKLPPMTPPIAKPGQVAKTPMSALYEKLKTQDFQFQVAAHCPETGGFKVILGKNYTRI